jgi:hypothetical protein
VNTGIPEIEVKTLTQDMITGSLMSWVSESKMQMDTLIAREPTDLPEDRQLKAIALIVASAGIQVDRFLRPARTRMTPRNKKAYNLLHRWVDRQNAQKLWELPLAACGPDSRVAQAWLADWRDTMAAVFVSLHGGK